MAQMVRDKEGLRYVENPAGEQLIPGGETAQAQWPAPMVPIVKSHSHEDHNDDHEHQHEHYHQIHDHEHHHNKKSVLTKVKEKARKWKKVLTRKKHVQEDEGNTTPSSGASLDGDDSDSKEDDHEYHGGTMYKSEPVFTMEKEKQALPATQMPTSITDQHHLATGTKIASSAQQNPVVTPAKPISSTIHEAQKEAPKLHHLDSFKERDKPEILTSSADTLITETKPPTVEVPANVTSKSVTETVTEMLAPAYNMVSEATHKIVAKIQSPTAKDETGAKMEWDRGVSVKDYLLQKLEPGEEERALSEVITEAISPTKGKVGLAQMHMQSEEMSVVEKVREAMSSLLGKDEQTGPQISTHSVKPDSVVEKVREAMSSLLGKDEQTGPQISTHSVKPDSVSTHVTSEKNLGTPSEISEVTLGHSVPAPEVNQNAILASEYQYAHETLNPISEDASESIYSAPSVESESTHSVVFPTSEYTHGDPMLAVGHNHGASVLASESKYNQGDLSPLPVSTNPFSATTSVTESPLAMLSDTTSLHGASPYTHGASIPASKRTDETSFPAFAHTQQSSVPASEYAHGIATPESKYNHGQVLPHPVSTNPFASPTSVTANQSLNHPSTNMSTFSNPTSHHEEVEETGGRRLQTN